MTARRARLPPYSPEARDQGPRSPEPPRGQQTLAEVRAQMAERRLRLRHLQRLGPLLKPHAQFHGDRTASLGRWRRLPERRRNRKRSPLSLALDYAPYCPVRERSAERLRFLPIGGSAHDGAPWGQDAHGAGAESLRRVVSAGNLCASLLAGFLALQGPLPTVRGPDCQF